jgi:3-methyladenine DNA glycosylase AlkD
MLDTAEVRFHLLPKRTNQLESFINTVSNKRKVDPSIKLKGFNYKEHELEPGWQKQEIHYKTLTQFSNFVY